ncbi:OmpH family outer membrane protein [Acinetobacter sp. Marseille-Q1618]|uniref:OmpH family outer membrane protein n=1 Tax=Acinetobacter sp. Marseille-Q1618 TaxID=2697502 RepID=UPI001570C06D|nr:OmpH family outer membrane protein [Acinetobacter sp. Marseille-Q1618]
MKKIVCALIGLGFTGLVNAAGYGVVDIEKVVESSTYLKQQNVSLEQMVKPDSAKLEKISKDIQSLQQQAQAKGANPEQIQKQYQAKVTEYQSIQQSVQAKVQTTIQNTNKTFETRVKQAAEQLRQENGLDMILNRNSTLAYDAKNDLTAKMIQKVNAIK